VLQGQAVSAIDGTAPGAVSVQVGSRFGIQSDENGYFEVDVGAAGTHTLTVSGNKIVERQTTVTTPTADRAKVTVIPSTFDMAAFSEMFRSGGRLQRWTTKPSLVIVGSIMRYVSGNTDRFQATGERLTDDEVTRLLEHLNEGLFLLTAGNYTTFASVTVEWPNAGDEVAVQRTGSVVIGRYTGVRAMTNTIGYGSWAERPDGTIVGGSIWLDRDFDRDDARRRLLRIHELGHALGYNHVTARSSVMNPAIGPEPTDFDRAGAAIAFQRPVGNVAPDTDPGLSTRTFSVSEDAVRWSTPIH
jgi:Matrixin